MVSEAHSKLTGLWSPSATILLVMNRWFIDHMLCFTKMNPCWNFLYHANLLSDSMIPKHHIDCSGTRDFPRTSIPSVMFALENGLWSHEFSGTSHMCQLQIVIANVNNRFLTSTSLIRQVIKSFYTRIHYYEEIMWLNIVTFPYSIIFYLQIQSKSNFFFS